MFACYMGIGVSICCFSARLVTFFSKPAGRATELFPFLHPCSCRICSRAALLLLRFYDDSSLGVPIILVVLLPSPCRRFLVCHLLGLDILVNNAAVCFNDPTLYGKVPFTPFAQQAGITVNTNFFGTLEVTEAMLPLLRASPSPRIVNVASAAGRLSILKSQALVEAFTSPTLELQELEALMREFVLEAEAGTHALKGWPNTCYGTSKLGLIALTRILARDEPGVMVNSVDPGYCSTDQNRNQGTVSAEEGARTAAMLAMLPDEEFVTGKHFYQGEQISWWYR